jgi:hypothetical protein
MFASLLLFIGVLPTSFPNLPPTKLFAAKERAVQFTADWHFGEGQVDQFICDRPDTAEILNRNNELRWMLIWKFSGGLKGKRVYWNNREVSPTFPQGQRA